MVDGSPPRHGAFLRRSRQSRLPLRLLYLLTGSALALSFLSVDLAVADALRGHEPVVLAGSVIVLVFVVPPTLLGMLPQLRHIEGVAAASLLGVDFKGHEPGLTRTWEQRWRTVAWFWAHLLAGVLAGCVVVGWVLAVMALISSRHAGGKGPLQDLWGTTAGGAVDVVLPVLVGVFLALVGLLLLVLCGEALVQLAPLLLGPSVPDLLAELESRTTHLVERARLARELHDSVGHALNVIVLHTAVARRRLPPDTDEVNGSLGIVEDAARRALGDLDTVLGLLREGQEAQTRHVVHDLRSVDELVRASCEGGQRVHVETEISDLATLPSVVSREAYRIVQEGLTNALRHAPDQPVHVRLAPLAEGLQVRVANRLAIGRSAGAGRGGRGLLGVRERVRALGGRVRAEAENGLWVLDVRLPLPRRENR